MVWLPFPGPRTALLQNRQVLLSDLRLGTKLLHVHIPYALLDLPWGHCVSVYTILVSSLPFVDWTCNPHRHPSWRKDLSLSPFLQGGDLILEQLVMKYPAAFLKPGCRFHFLGFYSVLCKLFLALMSSQPLLSWLIRCLLSLFSILHRVSHGNNPRCDGGVARALSGSESNWPLTRRLGLGLSVTETVCSRPVCLKGFSGSWEGRERLGKYRFQCFSFFMLFLCYAMAEYNRLRARKINGVSLFMDEAEMGRKVYLMYVEQF